MNIFRTQSELMKETNWKSVLVFYLLACLWSWPFFWLRDIHSESWKALEIPNFLKTWSYMWGPGIAAILCFFIFRRSHKREMTFRGTSFWHGIVLLLVLPSVLCVVNKDLKFLGLGMLGFVSILGEELGWRGFLQDALKIRSDCLKATILGTLWETWHFTGRVSQPPLASAIIRVCVWMVVLSVLSWVLIRVTSRTKSLLVAAALHMALDAAFEFESGFLSLLICLPLWLLIYRNWVKHSRTLVDESSRV